jgi:putative sugar O-methyltransferase
MNSISDTRSYKSACRNASLDENQFNVFKRNRDYNGILEHVNVEQGELYLNYIKNNFENLELHLEKFKKNDFFGGATLHKYEIGNISPSTLRYIKVLCDLKNLFGDLNNKKIIEIGVGYGGQCLVTSEYFTPAEYGLVDLDEALMLSEKYLNKNEVKHRVINIDSIKDLDEDFDLVISNYAYSELDVSLQDLYYEKIIKKSKHGYFTLNFISDIFGVKSYGKDDILNKFSEKSPKILIENPSTYENNIILHF